MDSMDREQINKIYSDYLNDCESEHDMEHIFTLAYKAIPSAEPTYYPPCEDFHKKMNEIRKAYDEIQSAEPKVGHWKKTPKAVMCEGYMWYCDKCGYEVYQDSSRDYPSENFCPDCGAKMN